MRLINTDGMVLIGPGSEWLWTAISGIVLAITFVAIYRQLRVQRSVAAMEQMTGLHRDWSSEAMLRARLAVVMALRDGVPVDRLPASVEDIGNFWERVSFLVRSGHVDRRTVHGGYGFVVQAWWLWLTPTVTLWREQDPGTWEDFEWLAASMRRLDRRLPRATPVDHAYLARTLPGVIEALQTSIRTAEDLRAVIVRPASIADVAPAPITTDAAPGAAPPSQPEPAGA